MNKQKLIELRCKAWGITEDEYYCNQCSDFSLEDMARAYRRGKNKGARDKAIQNVGFYQNQMQAIYDKKNKQIAELSKHILDLQKDKGNLTDRVRELEQQIEKMKQCGNCGNGTIGNCEHCKRKPNQKSTDTDDYWRLKEIKEK